MVMTSPVHHSQEETSNAARDLVAACEPKSLRTYTPTQAVLARSAGIYHWTPEGRRLVDFSSGVLVANLGHNPSSWMRRYCDYMGWSTQAWRDDKSQVRGDTPKGFFSALPMTAYNAVTEVETEATRRLLALLQDRSGGSRLQQVMWAASGSEAVQKALWAALARDKGRDMILATRHGFHGKKGLAGAVTGSEQDKDRDPRVRFLSFPMGECIDVTCRDRSIDLTLYRRELEEMARQCGSRIGALITEPYLGGGGSFHPQPAYLQLLQEFCRTNDVVFILDEVQSNFGRTGDLFAFETYGLEPDLVVLGKGLGNGVPVAAAVGRRDLFDLLEYGEGSDTWSANPLCCAAVLATLDEFADPSILKNARATSAVLEEELLRLKKLPIVAHVRGEKNGMVWGIEFQDHAGQSAAQWANAVVLSSYRGENGEGIHFLGPLAKKVLRVAPPLVMTREEARATGELLFRCASNLVQV